MPLSIVATPKATDANSYATEATALSYFEARVGGAAWTAVGVTAEQQKAALITATERLDQEAYLGVRTTEEQRLAWPRTGVEDESGYELDPDVIPRAIEAACCEVAFALLAKPTSLEGNALAAFEAVTVGPISLELRAEGTAPDALPAPAARYLRPFVLGGEGQVRLVRG